MRKILLFATFISLMAFSCEKEEMPGNTCGVNNPLKELSWLKSYIQRQEQNYPDIAKYLYIAQAEYNGQAVFLYYNCNPLYDTIVPVYNCQGELLFYLGQEPEKGAGIKNEKVIWKPANFACAGN